MRTAAATNKPAVKTQRAWHLPSLTTQILIGLVVGVLIGWLRPTWGNSIYFLRDIFLNLIKSIIGPLVFSTLVVGIAGGGDLRKVMHCRYALSMSSREIAGKFARTAQAVDALIYRGKKLLSDCVRVRLTTQGQNP